MFLTLISIVLAAEVALEAPADLDASLKKAQEDAHKNKADFDAYVKKQLKVDTAFELLPESKLDGKTVLVNPKGGRLDISTLGSDITKVVLKPEGGFSFTRKTKEGKEEELVLKGFDDVKADSKKNTIIADGVEMQFEQGKGAVEKTKEGILGTGKGKVFLDNHEYAFDTAKGAAFTIKEGKLQSIALSADEKNPAKMLIDKDALSVSKGTFTYFADEGLYAKAGGNKMTKKGDQFMVSQMNDGAFNLNGYYKADNGKLQVVPSLFATKGNTQLTYSYQGKESAKPFTAADAAKYNSIADLFADAGYGSGQKNKDARKAFYEKLFPGEKYKSYNNADQNVKLLNALKEGKAELYRAGEVTYDDDKGSFGLRRDPVSKKPAVRIHDSRSEQEDVLLSPPYERPLPRKVQELKARLEEGGTPIQVLAKKPENVVATYKAAMTRYYTCLEGDYGSYSSFERCVYTEGAGIGYGKDGKLRHFFTKQGKKGKYVTSEIIDPSDRNNILKYEASKRGWRGPGVRGTLEKADFAVPRAVFDKYKGHFAAARLTNGQWIKGRIADIGGAIVAHDENLIDVDFSTGLGASTMTDWGGLGRGMLNDKNDYGGWVTGEEGVTEFIILDEVDVTMISDIVRT